MNFFLFFFFLIATIQYRVHFLNHFPGNQPNVTVETKIKEMKKSKKLLVTFVHYMQINGCQGLQIQIHIKSSANADVELKN